MTTLIGPTLKVNTGFAYHTFSPDAGLRLGYKYDRIDQAIYARRHDLKNLDSQAFETEEDFRRAVNQQISH